MDDEELQEPLSVPFDVTLSPFNLLADDAPDQNEALQAALCATAADLEHGDKFTDAPVSFKPLSFFKRVSDQGDKTIALDLLRKRYRVDLPNSREFITSFNDPMLSWNPDEHFVDLMICVPTGLGLGALLPNQLRNHTFEFTFELSRTSRTFSPKFAKLGFDPTGSILWIGRSPSSEDVWLAWAPTESLDMDSEDIKPGTCAGPTQLSTKHYRITILFLAYLFTLVGGRDIMLQQNYPDLDDDAEFNNVTNLLQRTPRLKLKELRLFDRYWVRLFPQWVADAPNEYRDDFIVNRTLILMTSRYGQNQDIGLAGADADADADNWRTERDFSRIRFITIAVATHIRVTRVKEWREREVASIFQGNPDGIWTSPDQSFREAISLEELTTMDMLDQGGLEIPIYSEKGYQIQRRVGRWTKNTKSHGVLMDLRRIGEMFEPDHDAVFVDGCPGPQRAEYSVYPQAGMRVAGHFQAHGLMTGFYPRVEAVNRRIMQARLDENDDGVGQPTCYPPVTGIACQGYNSVMHSTRGQSNQHHDAQLGLLTGALAGAWATTDQHKRKANNIRMACTYNLPHQNFVHKISNQNIKRDLRLENVYFIDVQACPVAMQSGDGLLKNVIQPLASAWGHSSLIDELKKNVFLFTPEAYPQLYLWTSYPLTTFLEAIWKEGNDALKNNINPPAPLVEVCSVGERSLNFLHTGNAAVISTAVMNPLWIGRSLVQDGLPSFNPEIINIRKGKPVIVAIHLWPFDEAKSMPKTASKRAQCLTYNEGHFNTFFAYFAMAVAVNRPVKGIVLNTDTNIASAQSVAFHAMQLFVQDCKDLVSAGISVSLKRGLRSDDEHVQQHALRRNVALKEWLKLSHPLSWTETHGPQNGTYQKLITILNGNQGVVPTALGTDLENLGYDQLAQRMYNMAKPTSPAVISAPVMRNGAFVHALPVAITMIERRARGGQQPEAFAVGILEIILRKMQLHFIPWHDIGARAHAVRFDHWIILQHKPQAQEEEESGDDGGDGSAQIASNAAVENPSAPWTIPPKLSAMGSLWKKTVLPSDWALSAAGYVDDQDKTPPRTDASYVYKTYCYVKRTFDGTIWWHHMALVWGILFTQALPYIFSAKGSTIRGGSHAELTADVRRMPWIKGTSKARKGVTAARPFITMVTTTILALFDPKSPLREHMLKNSNTFGKSWTDKHGMKEINAINIVRMGFGKATGEGFVRRAKLGGNWELYSLAEMKVTYMKVMGYLERRDIGEYSALEAIFGNDIAVRAVKSGRVVGPTSLGAGLASSSQLNQSRREEEQQQEEDQDESD